MKQPLRALCVSLIAGGVVIAAVPIVTAQQTSRPTEAGLSRTCKQAQGHLQAVVRPRDLRARVDRLQAYQYITKRLDTFAQRLERHEQPHAQTIRNLTDEFSQTVDNFKEHYEYYDTARDSLATLQVCDQRPAEFAKRLAQARRRLAAVEQDAEAIDTLLAKDVPRVLSQLRQSLQPETEVSDE